MSTTNRNTRFLLVDPARVACLGNGDHAVVAVDQDGGEHPWLLVPDGNDGEPGCACAGCAPHEQPGPTAPARRQPPQSSCCDLGRRRSTPASRAVLRLPGLVTAVITTAVRAVDYDQHQRQGRLRPATSRCAPAKFAAPHWRGGPAVTVPTRQVAEAFGCTAAQSFGRFSEGSIQAVTG